MKKILYITLALCIISSIGKAQELRPYQFIQFFKAYQLENSIHILSGTDCLKGYDKQWIFMEPLSIPIETEYMHFWLYSTESV